MQTTLHYVSCDICFEVSDVAPDPNMNFQEALHEAVNRYGWHRVHSRMFERTTEKHICPNCWEFRGEDVDALRR